MTAAARISCKGPQQHNKAYGGGAGTTSLGRALTPERQSPCPGFRSTLTFKERMPPQLLQALGAYGAV